MKPRHAVLSFIVVFSAVGVWRLTHSVAPAPVWAGPSLSSLPSASTTPGSSSVTPSSTTASSPVISSPSEHIPISLPPVTLPVQTTLPYGVTTSSTVPPVTTTAHVAPPVDPATLCGAYDMFTISMLPSPPWATATLCASRSRSLLRTIILTTNPASGAKTPFAIFDLDGSNGEPSLTWAETASDTGSVVVRDAQTVIPVRRTGLGFERGVGLRSASPEGAALWVANGFAFDLYGKLGSGCSTPPVAYFRPSASDAKTFSSVSLRTSATDVTVLPVPAALVSVFPLPTVTQFLTITPPWRTGAPVGVAACRPDGMTPFTVEPAEIGTTGS